MFAPLDDLDIGRIQDKKESPKQPMQLTAPPSTDPQVPVWPRCLSRFHLEIGEGDAATGKGDTVLLAPAVLFKLRFLGSVPVKLTSHSAQLPVRQA